MSKGQCTYLSSSWSTSDFPQLGRFGGSTTIYPSRFTTHRVYAIRCISYGHPVYTGMTIKEEHLLFSFRTRKILITEDFSILKSLIGQVFRGLPCDTRQIVVLISYHMSSFPNIDQLFTILRSGLMIGSKILQESRMQRKVFAQE